MNLRDISRRRFLGRAGLVASTVARAGVPLALELAALGQASAQASDYKAIVCLFMFGGNDSANTVLPTDPVSWSTYEACRSNGPEPIALLPPGTPAVPTAAAGSPASLGGVLPIRPNFNVFAPENSARAFALHPCLGEAVRLFEGGHLAVIANTGPLIEPLTKAQYLAGTGRKPVRLFSHNDQQSTWQALAPDGTVRGWGGRFADLMSASNANAAFTNISTSGQAVFLSGQSVFQYQVAADGAVRIAGLDGELFGSRRGAANLRSIVTADGPHWLGREYARIVRQSIEAEAVFQAALATSVVEPPGSYLSPVYGGAAVNPLAAQLHTVARILGARSALGVRRQIFFVSMGGFDTHDNQNRVHTELMARVGHALGYFDSSLSKLGLSDAVTLFTASDFGRAFSSNGDGTDHGWGGHHFVLGGTQLLGREIHGRFPTVGLNHDDEVWSGSLLPAVPVEQIGASLGRWFGVSEGGLSDVFPHLANFASTPRIAFLR